MKQEKFKLINKTKGMSCSFIRESLQGECWRSWPYIRAIDEAS